MTQTQTEDLYRRTPIEELQRVQEITSFLSTVADQLGFEFVMQYMAASGFRSEWTARFYGYRPGMASPGQVSLIRQLWSEYTAGQGDDVTLGKWLDHSFKVAALRFVTTSQAQKVITALKKMKARHHQSRKAG